LGGGDRGGKRRGLSPIKRREKRAIKDALKDRFQKKAVRGATPVSIKGREREAWTPLPPDV